MKIKLLIIITLLNFSLVKAQSGIYPSEKEKLENWMYESSRAGEFYEDQIAVVMDSFQELQKDTFDKDLIFNLAKQIHIGLKKVFKTDLIYKDYKETTKNLVQYLGDLYGKESRSNYDSKRSEIMMGMLNNEQKVFLSSSFFLNRGLENEKEGSEYWMVAADQYLYAGFKIGNNYNIDEHIEIYKKFQYYVNQSKDKYYTERLQMYIPYYEPNL